MEHEPREDEQLVDAAHHMKQVSPAQQKTETQRHGRLVRTKGRSKAVELQSMSPQQQ